MMTLKDIKVSKNRIPVQNALWIRPMGGLTFKVYYPHGGDWAEMKVDSSPSPSPTPTPTPTPSSDVSYIKRTDCEGGKVIAGRCIPLNARVGNKYFFANGKIKFKSERYFEQETPRRPAYKYIYTYGYGYGPQGFIFDKFKHPPLIRKDNWNPIIVHIRSASYYAEQQGKEGCDMIVLEGKTIYYTTAAAWNLTCDTTSPYFKIINGHLVNTKKPRMPQYMSNEYSALFEAKHFAARRLKYRGARVRGTYKWQYRSEVPPVKVPISIKRQWKFLTDEKFAGFLIRSNSVTHSSGESGLPKTFMIREIVRRRKTAMKLVIRKKLKTRNGGWGINADNFEELNFLT